MPATMTQPTTPARAGGPRRDAPLVLPNPFVRASEEQFFPFDDRSIQMTAASIAVGPVSIPGTGFLRHVVLMVEATGGVGGAANVAAHEDSPWRAIRDISLTDTNGAQIVGPLDGYELFLANRWGVYAFEADPEQNPLFSNVASGAGASGNFSFMLRVPVEIAGRDALGALPNQNDANTYKLNYTVAPSAQVYTTAPATTLPTLRIRLGLEAWAPPGPADQRGVPNITVPPAMGTTQNWTRTQIPVNAGETRQKLPRVGQLIRNIILIHRDTATGLRSTTSLPDPFRVELDRNVLLNEWRNYRRMLMRERHTQALDAWDTGVIVLGFTHDLDYKPGNEMRDLYLPTTGATSLEILGTVGAAGTWTVLTNDVAPGGDVFAESN